VSLGSFRLQQTRGWRPTVIVHAVANGTPALRWWGELRVDPLVKSSELVQIDATIALAMCSERVEQRPEPATLLGGSAERFMSRALAARPRVEREKPESKGRAHSRLPSGMRDDLR
jgi:hypothetical protein